MKLIHVLIHDVAAFGRWVINKIEEAPAWLTHALVLLAKMIPAQTLAKATAHAEHLLNDYAIAKGQPLAELVLTEAEHTGLFGALVAGVKVFDPGLQLPDVHTVAALAMGYALRGVRFVESEINAIETAATGAAVPEPPAGS